MIATKTRLHRSSKESAAPLDWKSHHESKYNAHISGQQIIIATKCASPVPLKTTDDFVGQDVNTDTDKINIRSGSESDLQSQL